MNGSAHKPMNKSHFPVATEVAVTCWCSSIGPVQAVVRRAWDGPLNNEFQRFADGRSAPERITVPLPAKIVRVAPTASQDWLAAAVDRAYSGVSHISNLIRSCVVRTRRALERLGGFADSREIAGGAQ